jgi:hypothetical protein
MLLGIHGRASGDVGVCGDVRVHVQGRGTQTTRRARVRTTTSCSAAAREGWRRPAAVGVARGVAAAAVAGVVSVGVAVMTQ